MANMYLKYFSDNELTDLKYQFGKNIDYYKADDNSFFLERFEKNGQLYEFDKKFPDFQLNCNNLNPKLTDCDNIKIMYDNLKELTPSEATQEKLWSALSHTVFWKYIKYRKASNFTDNQTQIIKNNYFFNRGIKRSLFIHPLSRLWWAGYYTYDEKNTSSPFHFTDFLFKNSESFASAIILISSNNFISNKKIALGILTGIEHAVQEGIQVDKNQDRYRLVYPFKYLNKIGSVYLLDCLSREEIADRAYKYLKSIAK